MKSNLQEMEYLRLKRDVLELVYLWVEDYKNIHEQGFNFSPKFNCHYDGETLTINENLDEDGNKKYNFIFKLNFDVR